jgi:hypothetical protein
MEIVPFRPEHLPAVERFRAATLAEGNTSLAAEKFKPAEVSGNLLLCCEGDEVISLSLAEPSHYTGDPEVAVRVCRYHVLRSHRSRFLYCGFQMLEKHCQWADRNGYEVMYWTHDVQAKALNRLYQKKAKYGFGASNAWFDSPPFTEFNLAPKMRFQVSQQAQLLQYVYVRTRRAEFEWRPTRGIVFV